MTTSACLREGATKESKAGLTNFVYCSMTLATSRPRLFFFWGGGGSELFSSVFSLSLLSLSLPNSAGKK